MNAQNPSNGSASVDDVNTSNDVNPSEIQAGGRSFKSSEELANAYGAMLKDYTQKSQQLSAYERERANQARYQSPQEDVDDVSKAFAVLKERGMVTRDEALTRDEVDDLFTLRDFTASKNANTKYDDLKLSKDDERLVMERYKKGIPMEDTYRALKHESMVKHISEESQNYQAPRVNNTQGSRSPNADFERMKIDPSKLKSSRDGQPNKEVYNAIDSIFDAADSSGVRLSLNDIASGQGR